MVAEVKRVKEIVLRAVPLMKEGEGREEQKLSLDGLPKLTFEQKWKWCAVPCTASLAGMRSESRMRLLHSKELR
eukprot:COSAG06_NODE_1237_length_10134_cov_17.263777_2_plen_74_part_00